MESTYDVVVVGSGFGGGVTVCRMAEQGLRRYGPSRSLDIVAARGVVYRIEPSDGPIDRDANEAHYGDRRTLVQDDHWFDAVAVGVGCMSVICTVMLEVKPKHYLGEVREFHTWDEVRADLIDGEVLRANRHYEVLFSPYALKHRYPCLVTTRNYTTNPSRKPLDKRTRNWGVELASAFPLTPHLLNLIVDVKPSLSPWMMEQAIRALIKKEYDEVSYVEHRGRQPAARIFRRDRGPDGRTPHRSGRGDHLRGGGVSPRRRRVSSSPISFRFVKASNAYMSVMQGRDTMMIELIQLSRSDGGYELDAAYESALAKLGGRPHWGQVNTLTAREALLETMYPRYPDWLQVHSELNASGVVDSPFTKRVGISTPHFTP